MEIVYYSPHPDLALHSPSGYGTHMREMIRAFRDLGHEVTPVVMGGREVTQESTAPRSPSRCIKDAVKQVVPGQLWESLKDYRLIRQDRRFQEDLAMVVKDFAPDLIYERANYLQPSGVRVAREFHIPHVLEVNSPYVEEKETLSGTASWFRGRARSVEREQLQSTTQVATVSSALAHFLGEKHDVEGDKFTVAPNAIDPDKATTDPERVKKIRDRYDLSERFVVGFVGSIFPWHGVHVLIKAAHRLRKWLDAFKVLIVGDGEILPDLKQQRDELGLEGYVMFTGRVPHGDVFNLIEAMDIVVAPGAQWYQSPVKIFEYGAMRKPIIAPNTAPVREVMDDGTDGLLVDADAGELYEALRTLAEQESLREKIAQNFHRKVMENHTWEQNARKVLSSITHEADDHS